MRSGRQLLNQVQIDKAPNAAGNPMASLHSGDHVGDRCGGVRCYQYDRVCVENRIEYPDLSELPSFSTRVGLVREVDHPEPLAPLERCGTTFVDRKPGHRGIGHRTGFRHKCTGKLDVSRPAIKPDVRTSRFRCRDGSTGGEQQDIPIRFIATDRNVAMPAVKPDR